MLDGKSILVFEEEFLIAIDMQRILEQAHATNIAFLRALAEIEKMLDRLAEYDLAIIEMPHDNPAAIAFAKALIAAQIPLVLTSAESGYQRSLPAFPGVPVVNKPFSEEDLLAACTLALATAPPDKKNLGSFDAPTQ